MDSHVDIESLDDDKDILLSGYGGGFTIGHKEEKLHQKTLRTYFFMHAIVSYIDLIFYHFF
jgi:hypothetical protein